MYTPTTLATYLRASKAQLYRIRDQDPEFPQPVRLSARAIRCPEADIEDYLNKKKVHHETD